MVIGKIAFGRMLKQYETLVYGRRSLSCTGGIETSGELASVMAVQGSRYSTTTDCYD